MPVFFDPVLGLAPPDAVDPDRLRVSPFAGAVAAGGGIACACAASMETFDPATGASGASFCASGAGGGGSGITMRSEV